jgi:hypothetical protein
MFLCVAVPSEDRIRELCERVIEETDEHTLHLVIADLQSALREFIGATRSRVTGTISHIQALEARNKSKLAFPAPKRRDVA